jgi:hypothetical protein
MYVANSAYSAYCNPYWDANGNYVGSGAASGFSVVSILPTVSYANGWFRIGFVFTTDTDTSFYIYHSLLISGSNTNYTGDGVSGTYVFGPQVELGSFPTSYIATTGATATRATDVVTCASTALSTFNGSTGSCVAITSGWSSFNGTEASVAGGANRQLTADTSTNTQVETYNGTTALTATIGGSGTLAANVVKTAMSWDGTGRSIVANNGTLATDANTVGTATGTVYLGSATGSGTTFMDGYIQRVAGWTTRQPDATLQSLST